MEQWGAVVATNRVRACFLYCDSMGDEVTRLWHCSQMKRVSARGGAHSATWTADAGAGAGVASLLQSAPEGAAAATVVAC